MAANKVYKIPRNILAEMTNNNPQAISALENIEQVTERSPIEIADIIIRVESAASQAEQAAILATQAVAIINQMIADNQAPLQAVSVPSEPQTYLQAVSVSLDCQNQLIPVQGDI